MFEYGLTIFCICTHCICLFNTHCICLFWLESRKRTLSHLAVNDYLKPKEIFGLVSKLFSMHLEDFVFETLFRKVAIIIDIERAPQ